MIYMHIHEYFQVINHPMWSSVFTKHSLKNFKNNYKNNTPIIYNVKNTCKLKQEKSQYYL